MSTVGAMKLFSWKKKLISRKNYSKRQNRGGPWRLAFGRDILIIGVPVKIIHHEKLVNSTNGPEIERTQWLNLWYVSFQNIIQNCAIFFNKGIKQLGIYNCLKKG